MEHEYRITTMRVSDERDVQHIRKIWFDERHHRQTVRITGPNGPLTTSDHLWDQAREMMSERENIITISLRNLPPTSPFRLNRDRMNRTGDQEMRLHRQRPGEPDIMQAILEQEVIDWEHAREMDPLQDHSQSSTAGSSPPREYEYGLTSQKPGGRHQPPPIRSHGVNPEWRLSHRLPPGNLLEGEWQGYRLRISTVNGNITARRATVTPLPRHECPRTIYQKDCADMKEAREWCARTAQDLSLGEPSRLKQAKSLARVREMFHQKEKPQR